MIIESVELREIHLRLRERFEISSGGRQDRRILLLRLRAQGLEGWSECVVGEDPGYSYETTDTAWHVLSDFLLPTLIGCDFTEPEDLLLPTAWVRGHRMAKAAVEMAGWELEARRRGVSLASLLGGERDYVDVGVSVGLQPDDKTLLSKIEAYVDEGYSRIKIKIKPGRDIDMLRAVRNRFPELPMMADANSAYTLADMPRLREFDELDLMMIEQPLAHDDYREHAILQAELETPICLDESIRSVGDAELAFQLEACRIINIKPGRVGGLSSAKRIHDVCRARGAAAWCGGMLESGIGRAHNVALASLQGFTLPGDISASARYWDQDVVIPEFCLDHGRLRVPEGPGLGVTPDIERIESLTVRHATFP